MRIWIWILISIWIHFLSEEDNKKETRGIAYASSTSVPGGNQVDGLPPEPSTRSGDWLDLVLGLVRTLWVFDPKMYFYGKNANIFKNFKTIF